MREENGNKSLEIMEKKSIKNTESEENRIKENIEIDKLIKYKMKNVE